MNFATNRNQGHNNCLTKPLRLSKNAFRFYNKYLQYTLFNKVQTLYKKNKNKKVPVVNETTF